MILLPFFNLLFTISTINAVALPYIQNDFNFCHTRDYTEFNISSFQTARDFLLQSSNCPSEPKFQYALSVIFPDFKEGLYDMNPRYPILEWSIHARQYLDSKIFLFNGKSHNIKLFLQKNGFEYNFAKDLIDWKGVQFEIRTHLYSEKTFREKVSMAVWIEKNYCCQSQNKTELLKSIFHRIEKSEKVGYLNGTEYLLEISQDARSIVSQRIQEFNQNSRSVFALLKSSSSYFFSISQVTEFQNLTLVLQENFPSFNGELNDLISFITNNSTGTFLISKNLSFILNQPKVCQDVAQRIGSNSNSFITFISSGNANLNISKCFFEGEVVLTQIELSKNLANLNFLLSFHKYTFSRDVTTQTNFLKAFKLAYPSNNSFYYLENCNGDPFGVDDIECHWTEAVTVKRIVYKSYACDLIFSFFCSFSLSAQDFSRMTPFTLKSMLFRFSQGTPSLADVLEKDSWDNISKFFWNIAQKFGVYDWTGDIVVPLQEFTGAKFFKNYEVICVFKNSVLKCNHKNIWSNRKYQPRIG